MLYALNSFNPHRGFDSLSANGLIVCRYSKLVRSNANNLMNIKYQQQIFKVLCDLCKKNTLEKVNFLSLLIYYFFGYCFKQWHNSLASSTNSFFNPHCRFDFLSPSATRFYCYEKNTRTMFCECFVRMHLRSTLIFLMQNPG